MNCPKCNEKAYVVTSTKGATTLLGAGAGGYVAVAAGAKTGAVVGSFVCPGFGTVIGGLLGVITGAAAGVQWLATLSAVCLMRTLSECITVRSVIINGGPHETLS